MQIHMCIYLYVYERTWNMTNTYMYIYICIHICIYICICVYIYTCMYTFVHICTHTYTFMYTFIFAYIYTCIYTYTCNHLQKYMFAYSDMCMSIHLYIFVAHGEPHPRAKNKKQDQQNWIRGKFEKPKKFHYDEKATMRLLDRLIYAVEFESFLATKYTTTKRFGLEVMCMHAYI